VGERHNPETHLIPRVFMAAKGEIPALKLFGDDYPSPDGTCIRDYIHVCDLAEAHISALEKLSGGARGLKANLGTGHGYSVKQIIDESRSVIGREIPHSIEPRRAGDSPSLVAGVERAKALLGWQARHSSLENIISTAWNWFLKDKENRLNLPNL
jgi:UDP-glucose 4-epimerase